MPIALVLLLMVAAIVSGVLGFWLGRGTAPVAVATAADRSGEVERRDRFIESLRETTWQHRDLAPELSTIVLDEISTFRKELS